MTFVTLKTRVCGVNIEWFLFGLYKTLSDPQIPALYGLQSWDYHAARRVAARLLVKSCSKSWNDYLTLRKNQSPYNTLHQNLPWSVPLFLSNFTYYATPPSLTNFASNSKVLMFLKTGQTHSWLFPVFGTFFLQVSAWPTLSLSSSLCLNVTFSMTPYLKMQNDQMPQHWSPLPCSIIPSMALIF